MTGSLQIKNDTYFVVLNLYNDGKRNQKWISTGLRTKGNKRKAEKVLDELKREYEQPVHQQSCTIKFADYIRSWLESEKTKVDVITFQGYELTARTRVLPYFDSLGISLKDVTRTVLQTYFDETQKQGRLDGKGAISPASLKQYKNIINQALNEAVKNDLIPSNPCQFVELPRIEKYQSSYYNGEQLKQLFCAIENDILAPLIKITALYGLRRSEVLGIKWDSIDFASRRLTIRHTVAKVTDRVEKDKTKTASSRRSFALTVEAIEIFTRLKKDKDENRKFFGKGYIESDYVFTWPNGTPFSPDYVTRHFSKLLKKNNLPHIRFHELRHSCASLLLNNGFTLKDVQEYMGHSDIQVTADIYGHLDTSRKDMLAKGIENCIF